jgi:hypothetical protein
VSSNTKIQYTILNFYKMTIQYMKKNPDSSVGITTGYRLDGRGSIPGRGKRFSVFHRVQNGSGVHPAPYKMGTEGSFPKDKVTRG